MNDYLNSDSDDDYQGSDVEDDDYQATNCHIDKVFNGFTEMMDQSQNCQIVKIFAANKMKILQTDKNLTMAKKQVNDLNDELKKLEKEREHILEVLYYIDYFRDDVPSNLLKFDHFTEEKMNLIRPIIHQSFYKSNVITQILSKNLEDLEIIIILINHIRKITEFVKCSSFGQQNNHSSKIFTENQKKILQTEKNLASTRNKINALREELKKLEKRKDNILEVQKQIYELKKIGVPSQFLVFDLFTEQKMNLFEELLSSTIEIGKKIYIITQIMSKRQENIEIVADMIKFIVGMEWEIADRSRTNNESETDESETDDDMY